jgi:pyruvate kinase
MRTLVQHGVRIFRLNFSHSDAATFAPIIKEIRELEKEMGLPLTVMGDLCGPKIRIGEVKDAPLSVPKGGKVLLGLGEDACAQGPEDTRDFPFMCLAFAEPLAGLAAGMPVSLSDGMLQFKVSRVLKEDELFELEAVNAGILASNKGIAFPGKSMDVAALTEKDKKDLHEGLDVGLDAVAMSFVQRREDVLDVKAEIEKHGTWVPVVAKLERQSALDNLDSIIEAADALMVARGDLGLECPMAKLPIIQKRIIHAARHAQKAVIVATQMLLSMVKNPVPTRAETTDVANAILDGADCVMLSEETAVGSYPTEAVKLIEEIGNNAEEYFLDQTHAAQHMPRQHKHPVKYLTYAACLLADNLDAPALVCHSTTGSTARLLSSRRPSKPIYALTPDERVIKHLNFFWGVRPRLVSDADEDHVERSESFIRGNEDFKSGESFVITSGQPTPGQKTFQTNEIKIYVK